MDVLQALNLLNTLCEDDSVSEDRFEDDEKHVESVIKFQPLPSPVTASNIIIYPGQDTFGNASVIDEIIEAVDVEFEPNISQQILEMSTDLPYTHNHPQAGQNSSSDINYETDITLKFNPLDPEISSDENSPEKDSDEDYIPQSNQESETTSDAVTTLPESSDIDNNDTCTSNDGNTAENTNRSRKRNRYPNLWKQNMRKRRRQSGQSYVDSKGVAQRKRNVKQNDCKGTCRFRCTTHISVNERSQHFNEFWSLSDDEKHTFYAKTTEKTPKVRTRTKATVSRRNYSYKYFFIKDGHTIRVCKQFYLSTLDICQRRIEWYHKKAELNDFSDKRGTRTKSKITQLAKDIVRDHIKSFPRLPSHYCRQSTSREFLEADLSINKMYNLYIDICTVDGVTPVKLHSYRYIFNHEFNIGFYVPKKDRCDMCMEYKAQGECNTITSSLQEKFNAHIKDKTETRNERDGDRKDKEKLVVCFDLQNVLTCPRATVSNFFYKRKLNVFNLTAHCSLDKKAYCALWSEGLASRGGNEIASALITILESIVNVYPNATEITLWSDSCVPQNKNSLMCFALKQFLREHPSINTIIQKFCTPGHSSIQEVDNIHSHLEKGLKVCEVYSPVSLIRAMTKIRPKQTIIIQLKQHHFRNFKKSLTSLKFSNVPFTKLKYIMLKSGNSFHVYYKIAMSEKDLIESCIRGRVTREKNQNIALFPTIRYLNRRPPLSNEKRSDFKSMLKFMPEQDKRYFKVTFGFA